LQLPSRYHFADTVIIEIKSVERLLRLHEVQLLTYVRIGGYRLGLLMNFDTVSPKRDLRRRVL
jgi:GxxExxY protein